MRFFDVARFPAFSRVAAAEFSPRWDCQRLQSRVAATERCGLCSVAATRLYGRFCDISVGLRPRLKPFAATRLPNAHHQNLRFGLGVVLLGDHVSFVPA